MENSIEWWIDNRKISIEIYSISTENGIQFGLEICDISGESVVLLYESHDLITERIYSWKSYHEAKEFAFKWLIENSYDKASNL